MGSGLTGCDEAGSTDPGRSGLDNGAEHARAWSVLVFVVVVPLVIAVVVVMAGQAAGRAVSGCFSRWLGALPTGGTALEDDSLCSGSASDVGRACAAGCGERCRFGGASRVSGRTCLSDSKVLDSTKPSSGSWTRPVPFSRGGFF